MQNRIVLDGTILSISRGKHLIKVKSAGMSYFEGIINYGMQ